MALLVDILHPGLPQVKLVHEDSREIEGWRRGEREAKDREKDRARDREK